jgi:hypothetical protein
MDWDDEFNGMNHGADSAGSILDDVSKGTAKGTLCIYAFRRNQGNSTQSSLTRMGDVWIRMRYRYPRPLGISMQIRIVT